MRRSIRLCTEIPLFKRPERRLARSRKPLVTTCTATSRTCAQSRRSTPIASLRRLLHLPLHPKRAQSPRMLRSEVLEIEGRSNDSDGLAAQPSSRQSRAQMDQMIATSRRFPADLDLSRDRQGAVSRGISRAPRTAQELLGHRDVKTTMIYTQVLNRGGRSVQSPADQLVEGGARGREGRQRNTPRIYVTLQPLEV